MIISIEDNINELEKKIKDISDSKLNRIARYTINDIARNIKTKYIVPSSVRNFEHIRNKTFIKSMTNYEKSKFSRNINDLEASAGVYNKANKERAAKGLESQEYGRPIRKKFMPNTKIRRGGIEGRVRKKYYANNIPDYIDATGMSKKEIMDQVNKSFYKTKNPLLFKGKKRNNLVLPIKRYKKTRKYKYLYLYTQNINDTAYIKKAARFIYEAGLKGIEDVPKVFNEKFKKVMNEMA